MRVGRRLAPTGVGTKQKKKDENEEMVGKGAS